jgi:hypothetical protein
MTSTLLRTYGALGVLTAVAAAAAAAGVTTMAAVPAPHDALTASLATAAGLLSHNAAVALWPLALVTLGWPGIPGIRQLGDVLIAAQLLAHGLAVGGVMGVRPEVWRYLPHLPFEWLGLCAPAAGWALARGGAHRPGDGLKLASVSITALVVAAAVETWTVPL